MALTSGQKKLEEIWIEHIKKSLSLDEAYNHAIADEALIKVLETLGFYNLTEEWKKHV